MKLAKMRNLTIFLAALAAGIFPFMPMFLQSDRALLYRDLSLSFLPAKKLWLTSILSEFTIPRWNYLSLNGTPFYADLNASPLYPLNWLLLPLNFLGIERAFSFFIAFHYSLIFLGTFYLLRHLRVSFYLCVLFGICFSWSGSVLSEASLFHMLVGTLSIPWFLLFLLRYLKDPRCFNLMGASIFLALPIYGGDPQYSYILGIGALVLAVRKNRVAGFAPLAKLMISSFGMASAQLLPSIALALGSDRGRRGIGEAMSWSIHPYRLADLVWPNFFGSLSPTYNFWGGHLINSDRKSFFLYSFYLGSIVVFFLFQGLPLLGRKSFRRILPLFGLSLFFLLLSLGVYFPLYELFYQYLPAWSSFRYPERNVVWLAFTLLVLSALMANRFFAFLRWKNKDLKALWSSTALFSALSMFGYFLSKNEPTAGRPALEGLGFFLAFAVAIALQQKKLIQFQQMKLILLLFVFLDFTIAFPKIIWLQSTSICATENYPSLVAIQSDLQQNKAKIESGRNFHFLSPDALEIKWTESANQALAIFDVPTLSMLAWWESLAGNLPSFFGLADVTGYYSLAPRQKDIFADLLKEKNQLFFDLTGVYYLLERSLGNSPKLRINPTAVDYVFFPTEVVSAIDPKHLERQLLAPDFDPHKKALLQSKETLSASASAPKISKIQRSATKFSFLLTASAAYTGGTLIWNESFSPLWRWKNERPILANLWSMGWRIPPLSSGESLEVQFTYDDPLIPLGMALTIFATLALLLLSLKELRKRSLH